MTLVFAGLGDLIQTQFGVNEIAYAVTIGKFVSSVFSRKADAGIFGPLTKHYDLCTQP